MAYEEQVELLEEGAGVEGPRGPQEQAALDGAAGDFDERGFSDKAESPRRASEDGKGGGALAPIVWNLSTPWT